MDDIKKTNKEVVEREFRKHPTIMKSLLKMKDIQFVSQDLITHFKKIIDSGHIKSENLKLSYNQYENFLDLYFVIKKFLILSDYEGEVESQLIFKKMKFEDKIGFLKTNEIEFKKDNGVIIIYPKSYEETVMVGSSKWCIVESEYWWNQYNKNKTQIILIKDDDVYGMSLGINSFYCFDKSNRNITYSKLKNTFQNSVIKEIKVISPSIFSIISLTLFSLLLLVNYYFFGNGLIDESKSVVYTILFGIIFIVFRSANGNDSAISKWALSAEIFIMASAIVLSSVYVSKDLLHSVYNFENTLKKQEEIQQYNKSKLNDIISVNQYTENLMEDWEREEKFYFITKMIINSSNNDLMNIDEGSFLLEDINNLKFSPRRNIIIINLIREGEFDKLKILLKINSKYLKSSLQVLMLHNEVKELNNILLENNNNNDFSFDNNEILRWASYNKKDEIIKTLMLNEDVLNSLSSEWVDNYLSNENHKLMIKNKIN